MNKDTKIILFIGIISLGILVSAILFLGGGSADNSRVAVNRDLLVREDSFKIASESAQLTLVEFSDFECPACAVAHPETKQLLEEYSGKLNFVFRHFPLPQHSKAIDAAIASEAANRQNGFIQMADKLFDNQGEWQESSKHKEVFIRYAGEIGLDEQQFKADLEDKSLTEKVKRDYQDAVSLKINSTPTFFLGDERIEGLPSYEQFKASIDSKLNQYISNKL
ncbi:MAG: DsbA family protein [Armatimonadetes bacterium]|nr:MAG: DsbA family protein [Armatimonadota bacterium]